MRYRLKDEEPKDLVDEMYEMDAYTPTRSQDGLYGDERADVGNYIQNLGSGILDGLTGFVGIERGR